MNVWQSLTEIAGNEVSVVTIGNFDGMHNGHKKVIRHLRGAVPTARRHAWPSPSTRSPIQVHKPEVGLQLISPAA